MNEYISIAGVDNGFVIERNTYATEETRKKEKIVCLTREAVVASIARMLEVEIPTY